MPQAVSIKKPFTDTATCAHCSAVFAVGSGNGDYCCRGCESAARLLLDSATETGASDAFAYLDSAEFRQAYGGAEGRTLEFYLEGVHCLSCISLVEKLPNSVPGVERAVLDFARSVATVTVAPGGLFAAVARELARQGYVPHPVLHDEEKARFDQESRRLLIQLAVAAACSGNIMLFAIALYAGADQEYRTLFRWGSFVLALPVLGFSAESFFRGAFSALRAWRASIDIPIAFGLIMGSAVSFVNLLRGAEHIYFDSIASLVFLLLSTRILLRKVSARAEATSRLVHYLAPANAHRYDPRTGGVADVRTEALMPHDLVRVLPQECFPVDGVILEGTSLVSRALLTGEAAPVTLGAGDAVHAGTKNETAPLLVRTMGYGADTRIGRMLRLMETSLKNRAPIVDFTDTVGKFFVLGTLALTVIAYFVGLATNFAEAVERALAMAIIVCPCTFALATPLAFSLALERAARAGILVKGAEVIERLAQIRTIFFDKTGTLTQGAMQVVALIRESAGTAQDVLALAALEAGSMHPIARAVQTHLKRDPRLLPEVTDFREQSGVGITGTVFGNRYEVKQGLPAGANPDTVKHGNSIETEITLYRDGTAVLHVALADAIRDDARPALGLLHAAGYKVHILSGDAQATVDHVARELGIRPGCARGEASPEEKGEIAARTPLALVVGDGANDALALASAHVGVAVHGGMEVSMKAAGAFCSVAGVQPIVTLLTIARETMRVVKRNLAFAILYNIVGITAAMSGELTPLFAALLMPASASTIFLSTIAGTTNLRRASREARR